MTEDKPPETPDDKRRGLSPTRRAHIVLELISLVVGLAILYVVLMASGVRLPSFN